MSRRRGADKLRGRKSSEPPSNTIVATRRPTRPRERTARRRRRLQFAGELAASGVGCASERGEDNLFWGFLKVWFSPSRVLRAYHCQSPWNFPLLNRGTARLAYIAEAKPAKLGSAGTAEQQRANGGLPLRVGHGGSSRVGRCARFTIH
jgi:hypothetical protein